MHAVGWQVVPLVAVETVGADSLNAAVAAGELVTLEGITSIATSLGARRVSERAFEWTKQHEVVATTVTDDEAVRACLDVADEHRLVVEPACGAAVAAAVQRRVPALQAASQVLVVLCGGACTTYGDLLALAGPRQDAGL
jgi:L-serine/L-threonine ammonia-lyase